MKNLGKTSEFDGSSETYYPSLYLEEDQLEILNGATPGQEVTLIIKGKVRSMTVRDDDQDGREKSATVDIIEADNAREKTPEEKMYS